MQQVVAVSREWAAVRPVRIAGAAGCELADKGRSVQVLFSICLRSERSEDRAPPVGRDSLAVGQAIEAMAAFVELARWAS